MSGLGRRRPEQEFAQAVTPTGGSAGDTTMISPHDQERLAAFVDRFIVGAEIAPPFQAEAGTRRQKWTSQQRALESHNRDRAFLY